jgi:hypothetical protein
MALHIIKLCVGADSIADLKAWQDQCVARPRQKGRPPEPYHVTRMAPSRRAEVLDGGSLYWVIRGVAAVRQRIVDLVEVQDEDGIKRCAIVLDPELVITRPAPRKAFQGWRYLKPEDAPADLAAGEADGSDLPEALRRQLVELGAW